MARETLARDIETLRNLRDKERHAYYAIRDAGGYITNAPDALMRAYREATAQHVAFCNELAARLSKSEYLNVIFA